MLDDLLQNVSSAGAATLSKYALRAMAAIPFFLAAGFATAALTLTLIERFGASVAYTLLAVGFAMFAVLLNVATRARDFASWALPNVPRHALMRASGILNLLLAALIGVGIALYTSGRSEHPSSADRTVLARPAVAN